MSSFLSPLISSKSSHLCFVSSLFSYSFLFIISYTFFLLCPLSTVIISYLYFHVLFSLFAIPVISWNWPAAAIANVSSGQRFSYPANVSLSNVSFLTYKCFTQRNTFSPRSWVFLFCFVFRNVSSVTSFILSVSNSWHDFFSCWADISHNVFNFAFFVDSCLNTLLVLSSL